jgi:phospholipid transport system substrate-binding protein
MNLKHLAAAALMAALAAPLPAAYAQAADPGAAQIETLNVGILGIMKQSGGVEARFRAIKPVVEQVYDMPIMTRFAVGPKWAGLASQDQDSLIQAFTRLTAASYAHNFDNFSGEKFVVDPGVQTRGPDKLVRSHILSTGKPVDLTYRMRQAADGRWKVIDVYYNGSISELTTRRSDFAASVDSGGAPTLLKKINALTDKLMR